MIDASSQRGEIIYEYMTAHVDTAAIHYQTHAIRFVYLPGQSGANCGDDINMSEVIRSYRRLYLLCECE